MKVVIVYSPDPIYMNKFIYQVIKENHQHISAVIITKGSAIKKKNIWASLHYFVALLVILGIPRTIKNLGTLIYEKLIPSKSIQSICALVNISYYEVTTINSKRAKEILIQCQPDLIFNQSQHILKKDVLDIPRFGVFNRHGALLPTYRGRLAPFWQILNKEKNGGLTYHLMDEKIDNGPIILQERIPIEKNETVHTLVEKMFDRAVKKFSDVLSFFEKPDYHKYLKENEGHKATYYSSPTLRHALQYRFAR